MVKFSMIRIGRLIQTKVYVCTAVVCGVNLNSTVVRHPERNVFDWLEMCVDTVRWNGHPMGRDYGIQMRNR